MRRGRRYMLAALAAVAVGTWAGLTPALRHAQAELPPLSPAMLRQRSDAIIEGTVHKVQSKVVPAAGIGAGSTNRESTAQVVVERVMKGKGIPLRKIVMVRYWRAERRPSGWAGPGGQYKPLAPNDRVRVYLSGDTKNGWSLLIPNGWEPLPTQKDRSTAGEKPPK